MNTIVTLLISTGLAIGVLMTDLNPLVDATTDLVVQVDAVQEAKNLAQAALVKGDYAQFEYWAKVAVDRQNAYIEGAK